MGRQLGDLARGVDPGQAGHPNIEKDDVRMMLRRQLDRFEPVARFGNDFQFGPDFGQAGADLLAHQAFVIGYQGFCHWLSFQAARPSTLVDR